MLIKVPSVDWSDQVIYLVEEEDLISDGEEEPDFSEYMWMENEEEFDKNELQRLEEEDIMNECFAAMVEDELEEQLNDLEATDPEELQRVLKRISNEYEVENSVLNPLADEFIPSKLTSSTQ